MAVSKVVFYTTLALLAFASNSILCRMALGENTIDAASFTSIRLLSGIIVLAIIIQATQATQAKKTIVSKGSWKASIMLFIYAATFSYAYISLDTGVGALILFGAVQITMILAGLLSGNKLHSFEWLGLIIAFSGFIYLIMPGITAPPLTGFILMSLSGIAWGIYTLAGRSSQNPLFDTASNFLRTLPFVLIFAAATIQYATLSTKGIALAILSGGIASGVGYSIWYAAIKGLSATQAAVVQLLVPVIAAFGGVMFVNELFSFRLALSSAIILVGILIVILGKHYSERKLLEN